MKNISDRFFGVGAVADGFLSSGVKNKAAYNEYFLRLVDLAINRFKYTGMPDSVDVRYLELMLCLYGNAIFFKDEYKGFMGLGTSYQGWLNDYGVPRERQAIAANGQPFINLNETNSVLMFNNRLRTPDLYLITLYSERLWDIQRSIDTNTHLQKFPVLVRCDEKERMTYQNLMKQYSGNEVFIWGTKNLEAGQVEAINLNVPFVANDLLKVKHDVFNEALTALGIVNGSTDKRERLVADEARSTYGAVEMSRKSALNARKQACAEINRMWPELNIDVEFDSEIPISVEAETAERGVEEE